MLAEKELQLPNIYTKIPQMDYLRNKNNLNLYKISKENFPENVENTKINYEGLRKKYLKSRCN